MFLFPSFQFYCLLVSPSKGNAAAKLPAGLYSLPYACVGREGRKRSNFSDPGDILGCGAEKKMNRKEVTEMSGHKLKRSLGPRDTCIIPEKK